MIDRLTNYAARFLYNISYRCARAWPGDLCMQDTFARATHSAGQARRATIGYIVYNGGLGLGRVCARAKISCIQLHL